MVYCFSTPTTLWVVLGAYRLRAQPHKAAWRRGAEATWPQAQGCAGPGHGGRLAAVTGAMPRREATNRLHRLQERRASVPIFFDRIRDRIHLKKFTSVCN